MIKKSEFAKRRKHLIAKMGKNAVAIIPTAPMQTRNRDSEFPYRPDSDFYYLTGFAEPEAIAVIRTDGAKKSFVLFCRERDRDMEIWNGRREGPEGAIANFGADAAYPIHQLDELLPKLLENCERLFYTLGRDEIFDKRLIGWINEVRHKARSGIQAPQEIQSLDHPLHELRLIKSADEIRTMKAAAKVAAEAHCRAMRTCKPGMMEYAIEAELLYTFHKHGCEPAYNTIVGSGENACILHYIENNIAAKSGDLLLIDAGAEYQYYASDITRTFPVNGKFSDEQKALYEIVLEAQLAAIKQIKPGNHWNQSHDAAVRVLTKGLAKLGLLKGDLKKLIKDGAYRKFYMHRTGHWLGMDVHDVGEYKQNGKWRKLRPGMVLTVEPGLYVAANTPGVAKKWWNIGIRIEDDVVVTTKGCDVISRGVPKTVQDIEALMAKAQ